MEEPVIDRILCPIRIHARTSPDRTAIIEADTSLSYRQLDRYVSHTAARLKENEIEPGDVVAALAFNSIPYAVLLHASLRLGCVLMPLNCRLTESDWRSHIDAAQAKSCFVDDDHDEYLASHDVPVMRMDELMPDTDSPEIDSHDDIECILDRDSLIIFSSGTTGDARGVVLTLSNLYHSAFGAIAPLHLQSDDCWLAALPFYHIGGISIPFRTALAGCSTHIMRRFDAKDVIYVIPGPGISYLSLVPTMLRDLLDIDTDNVLATCKGIILGGAGWDESLREKCIKRKLPILTTYGLTETASMVTLLPPGSSPDRMATAGIALPNREAMIVDDNKKKVPVGTTGRIAVRGPVLFSRYLNSSESSLIMDGWFVTEDIGKLDPDGFLTVIGRTDSILISGGENIDLNHIEHELNSLQGIHGAVVLARKDNRWGRRPIAFVEVSDETLTELSIADALSSRLPKIMIPDRIVAVESLPVTGSGKYDRQAIKDKFSDLF